MSRVRDHLCFALRFSGLGYVMLWLLCAFEQTGAPFGATLICKQPLMEVIDWVCGGPHPLSLSAGLHMLGALSTLAVAAEGVVRLLRYGLTRLLHRPFMVSRWQSLRLLFRRRAKSGRRPRVVVPRREFGLRGARHTHPALATHKTVGPSDVSL